MPTPNPRTHFQYPSAIPSGTPSLEPAMHQTFQRSKKLSEFQHYRQTSITRRDHQARSPGAITKRCLPEIASRHRTNDPKPTHDHPVGLPLARAELLVRIVHDEVEEH